MKCANHLDADAAVRSSACRIKPEVPAYLVCDPGNLRQIILNLGGNAIKLAQSGEIPITVSVNAESEIQSGSISPSPILGRTSPKTK